MCLWAICIALWRNVCSDSLPIFPFVGQLCLTVCNAMDCSPPGSSVLGILHARILEWAIIKRNAFESVLMRWMNLEPIIQSEVSQKEKDKYHILIHIYGI